MTAERKKIGRKKKKKKRRNILRQSNNSPARPLKTQKSLTNFIDI